MYKEYLYFCVDMKRTETFDQINHSERFLYRVPFTVFHTHLNAVF